MAASNATLRRYARYPHARSKRGYGSTPIQSNRTLDRKSDHRAVPERGGILFDDPIARLPHGVAHFFRVIVGKALIDLGHDFGLVGILNDDVGRGLDNRPDGGE